MNTKTYLHVPISVYSKKLEFQPGNESSVTSRYICKEHQLFDSATVRAMSLLHDHREKLDVLQQVDR